MNRKVWKREIWTAVVAVVAGFSHHTLAQSIYGWGPKSPTFAKTAATLDEPKEWLIFLNPGTDATDYAVDNGLVIDRRLKSNPNAYVFKASPTISAAPDGNGRASAVYLNRQTNYTKSAFVPNDPYFFKEFPNSYWDAGQWHLVNTVFPEKVDVNIQGAWNNNVTGQGVTIGIVDDSFQTTHPDLAPNYVAADSWDFGGNDPVPDPVHQYDVHGIAVAGIAAARGGNGIGVTGAAPYASMAGLRIDFENQTDADFVDATLYHSSGANTNIAIKNHSYGIPAAYIHSPADSDALQTSTAAGTIHVVAAGNERFYFGFGTPWEGDSNKKDLQNESGAITVAALGPNGKYAYYSNFGNNVFVTAPSSGYDGVFPGHGVFTVHYGTTTTDRLGSNFGYGWWDEATGDFADEPVDYTNNFGGTSSASPLVAGVLALAKEVQPNLNTRFAKHLLVRTSTIVDPDDSTISGGGDDFTPGSAWLTNAAGNHFNQNYGFGLINATALVAAATQYSGVSELIVEKTGGSVGLSIPDDGTFAAVEFTLTTTVPVEDILVSLIVNHEFVDDIEAYLISPSGTITRLMLAGLSGAIQDVTNFEWTLLANAFWGENGAGVWTLKLKDTYAGADYGEWLSFSIEAHFGELIPIPEPGTAMLLTVSGMVLLLRRRARAGI